MSISLKKLLEDRLYDVKTDLEEDKSIARSKKAHLK